MVLKIEYLLILVIAILIASILGINPHSKPVLNRKGNKEVTFKNFSLFELKVDSLGREVFAKEATKYMNYLDLKEINISNEFGDKIFSKRAIYEDNNIFMQDKVFFERKDGLIFVAENLNYDLKKKILNTLHPFEIILKGIHIKGIKLKYQIGNEEISGEQIEARISIEK